MPLVQVYAPAHAHSKIDSMVLDAIQRAGSHLGYSMHEIWITTSVLARPDDVVFVAIDVHEDDAKAMRRLKLMCEEIATILRTATQLSVEVVLGRFDPVSWLATEEGKKRYPS